MEPLLKFEHVTICYNGENVVQDINLELNRGEILGVVGESGSGKSTIIKAVMGLLGNEGMVTEGDIWYKGKNVVDMQEKELRTLLGPEIAMIFQEPMNSLNPVFTVGNQLVETLLRHEDMTRRDAWDKSVDMLKAVGIPSPEKRMHDYSFQMSGGMRQRVMIAMSLCLDPDILIADEPTTALDVTVQAQILDLLREMQDRVGASIIMITHDHSIANHAAKVMTIRDGVLSGGDDYE